LCFPLRSRWRRRSPNSPEQFAEVVKRDAARWAEAVRVSGAKVD